MSGHITIPYFQKGSVRYPAFEDAYAGYLNLSRFSSLEDEREITIPAAMLAISPTHKHLTWLAENSRNINHFFEAAGGQKGKIKPQMAETHELLLNVISKVSAYQAEVTEITSSFTSNPIYTRANFVTMRTALQYAQQGHFVHIVPDDAKSDQDINAEELLSELKASIQRGKSTSPSYGDHLTGPIKYLKELEKIPPIRQAFKLQIQPIDERVPVECPGGLATDKRKIVPLAAGRGLKRSMGGR